ncbi:MAG TPA: hypothetical protein VN697_14995 [Tepidiformaceae bacterium]|nr:hypothetical protein [Tepidiformaceae bacterium]
MEEGKSRSKTLYRAGQCPTHGDVQAEKQIPKVSFPFIVWAFVRVRAAFGRYSCPECGAKVSSER